jgi:hypothetical protein
MRENRTCGSEGGEPGDRDSPTPILVTDLERTDQRADEIYQSLGFVI